MNSYVKLREAITKLANTQEELIKQLYSICNEQVIKKGEFFIRAGEISRYMALNLDGLFRFYYIDEEGNDYTKGFNKADQFLMSYSAVVQKRPSFFSIEALQDSHILKFDFEAFNQMMREDIRWYPFTFKLLEKKYVMKELRERSFLLENAEERYQDFKKDYAEVADKIKLYHVASFIGITPEALSRLRKMEKLM